ncbi:MAG: molybdenum cofactor synthesis domain-containing protein [Pseudomonadota bacterium]|nr:molybdenum cofactor synthesis domain-containing protein [Pseudomonadota bacterium]
MRKKKSLNNDCFALPRGTYWTPVDTALQHLKSNLKNLAGVEKITLGQGVSRILSRPVFARRNSPPFANSAVDGYGFAKSRVPKRGRIKILPGQAAAGRPFENFVPNGFAVKVLTGAILPDGVDTVVLQEEVSISDNQFVLETDLQEGANTRPIAEDVRAKDLVLGVGHVLRSQDLALLTSVGISEIEVYSALNIGVFSTGDELVENNVSSEKQLDEGNVYDSNRPMLLSLIRKWGQNAHDLGILPDDKSHTRRSLNKAAQEMDIIVTSGGASSGDEDHISKLLSEEGRLEKWRIAVKPGRPMAFGFWRSTPIFSLPGNPVAAFVCSLVFFRPSLGVLAGGYWHDPECFFVPSAFEKKKKPGRREFLRVRMEKDGGLECFPSEGSGRISSLTWSTGLVELSDDLLEVKKGDLLKYIPYSSFDF